LLFKRFISIFAHINPELNDALGNLSSFKKHPTMKKNISFILFLFSLFSFSQVSDLIISEYAEGGGNNKFVEIYNGTGSPVNLANYTCYYSASRSN